MRFDGTIIITDPCYVIKENTDDWEKCDYGENFEALGIHNYMTQATGCGDWSCHCVKLFKDPIEIVVELANMTGRIDDQLVCEEIGQSCADSGLVSVFDLDELRKYNPDIDKFIVNHPHTVTTIANYHGDVDFLAPNGITHVAGKGNINFLTIGFMYV